MTLNLVGGDRLADTPRIANGDRFVYDNRVALFKSAEGDYRVFRNVSPPSPVLQLLDVSYLKVLAALAKAGVPSGATASTTV